VRSRIDEIARDVEEIEKSLEEQFLISAFLKDPRPVVLADYPPPKRFLGKLSGCWAEGVCCQVVGQLTHRRMKRVFPAGGRPDLVYLAFFILDIVKWARLLQDPRPRDLSYLHTAFSFFFEPRCSEILSKSSFSRYAQPQGEAAQAAALALEVFPE
jgi:hypothetical protein